MKLIRGLDQQRRIIIPKETLFAAGLEPGDLVELYAETGPGGVVILLQKYRPGCVFCDEKEGLKRFKDRPVCGECVNFLGVTSLEEW